jgi:hypothetical protein
MVGETQRQRMILIEHAADQDIVIAHVSRHTVNDADQRVGTPTQEPPADFPMLHVFPRRSVISAKWHPMLLDLDQQATQYPLKIHFP